MSTLRGPAQLADLQGTLCVPSQYSYSNRFGTLAGTFGVVRLVKPPPRFAAFFVQTLEFQVRAVDIVTVSRWFAGGLHFAAETTLGCGDL